MSSLHGNVAKRNTLPIAFDDRGSGDGRLAAVGVIHSDAHVAQMKMGIVEVQLPRKMQVSREDVSYAVLDILIVEIGNCAEHVFGHTAP